MSATRSPSRSRTARWTYDGAASVRDHDRRHDARRRHVHRGPLQPDRHTGLNLASIIDAQPEIALSGTGLGTIALDTNADREPELLADGRTVRYYLTGAFAAGTRQGRLPRRHVGGPGRRHAATAELAVLPDDRASCRTSPAAPTRTRSSSSTSPAASSCGSPTSTPSRCSRSAARSPSRSASNSRRPNKTRFQLDASGTIKVYQARQHRLGRRHVRARDRRLASPTSSSGASPPSRRTSSSSSSTASSSRARCCCRSTPPSRTEHRDALARGHPGRRLLRGRRRRRPGPADRHVQRRRAGARPGSTLLENPRRHRPRPRRPGRRRRAARDHARQRPEASSSRASPAAST